MTRLLALGGLGEIGLNCMAVFDGDEVFLVDCGATFPSPVFGTNRICPRFDPLLLNPEQVRGVVLTHAHEDHIGALPYFLELCAVPVYGPPYALSVLRENLREHILSEEPQLVACEPRVPFRLGSFEIEPLRVVHSTQDSTALAIRTSDALIVHTGDFKLPDPASEQERQRFDRDRLEAIAAEGVDLLLSDSTNSEVAGRAGSEHTVAEALQQFIASARARVVVALFASNTERVSSLLDIAAKVNRRVALLGRAMQMHFRLAEQAGHLRDRDGVTIPASRAATLPKERLLALVSGSQGEPLAALSRIAQNTHPDLELSEGDVVVLSSRIIPGSELAVAHVIDAFERRGIRVFDPRTLPGIHVSGHACRDEQKEMIELVQPKTFIPVHGHVRHLRHHAELATSLGVSQALVALNGELVELQGNSLVVIERVETGRFHVADGLRVEPPILRDRTQMARAGLLTVSIGIDERGRLRHPPEVRPIGVLLGEAGDELCRQIRSELQSSIQGEMHDVNDVPSREWLDSRRQQLQETATQILKRIVRRSMSTKPVISVTVHVCDAPNS